MLTLERKVGERFVVLPGTQGEIIIELVATRGNRAKISFDAPAACRIYREEVHILKKAEDANAAL